MTSPHFFDNPHFLDYLRFLHRLHRLIRANADETPEGEALREQMDKVGANLAAEEVDCLNALSADFYTLGEPPRQVPPSSLTAREELKKGLDARDARDYVQALALLRKNQLYRDAAATAYLRGTIWAAVGENAVAVDFFHRAHELAPENGNYGFLWLDALWRDQPDEALKTARAILQQPLDNPPPLVLKAADVAFTDARQLPEPEASAIVRSLVPVFEDVVLRLQASGEEQANPFLLRSAIALLGLAYGRLGDSTEAVKYFEKGLHLYPANDLLITTRRL